MKSLFIAVVIAALSLPAFGADTQSEVNRLWRQASSGEIRFQKLVQPSKDSLSAMGDSAAKYLVDKLNTTDAREKLTLVDIFRGIGKKSTPYLTKSLQTENKDQLRTVCRCLADVKDSSAIPALLKIVTHADFTVRGEAITAIGKSGAGVSTSKLLEPMFSDSIDLVRKCVAYGLGVNKDVGSLPALVTALTDNSFMVRLCAYDAIAAFDSLAHKEILHALGNPQSRGQQVLLLRLAGQLGIKQAKPLIVKSLEDSSSVVRGWSVWSFARVGDNSTKSRLEELRKSEKDIFVLTQLQDALAYLSTSKAHE